MDPGTNRAERYLSDSRYNISNVLSCGDGLSPYPKYGMFYYNNNGHYRTNSLTKTRPLKYRKNRMRILRVYRYWSQCLGRLWSEVKK